MTKRKIDSPIPPIAVIGVGTLFPGSPEADGFWKDIVAGRDCFGDVPATHWLIDDYYDPDQTRPGKTYARRGAFISPVKFDPIDHGMPPKTMPSTDTAQLLALIVAKRVLEDACGLKFTHIARDRTSVILGVASATELVSTMSASLQRPVWVKALREEGLPEDQVQAICDRMDTSYADWTESTFPGLLGNVVAGRIANRFDLGGTNCVIDAACASSLGAVRMAIQELATGDSDMVITGGVDAINDIFMYMCFSKTPAMSPTGDCRPFSDDADGTMLGEGLGMVALRRLSDAERDGDHIYAVLRGIGSSSDGRAKSIYAPRAEGQAHALRRAYAAAGYGPETVEMLEAHGTGTSAGDAAEVSALKTVFGEEAHGKQGWCAIGSVKSQIGHTKAAAGAASLYKAVMALHHKVLPPTIKIQKPNPALGLVESPFYLNTEARPWIRGADHPRRASVSSFGFGGSNFHVTLEEYVGKSPKPARIRALPSELFLLSAGDGTQLGGAARALCDAAEQNFAPAARMSQQSFDAKAPCRLAVVARNAADLRAKLDDGAARVAGAPATSFTLPTGITYGHGAPADGGIAFLFPGQGSQYVGMGAGLAMAFDAARAVWDTAAGDKMGEAVVRRVFPAPAFDDAERKEQHARLTETQCAQPAIGLTSIAYLDLLKAAGVQPAACGGHSFGELTALHCAGAITAKDFNAMAQRRGALMADAARGLPGAMLAVMAPLAEVEALLAQFEPGLVVANINAPEQVVVAGPTPLIEALAARLDGSGKAARRLPVSTAFHSLIVAPAVGPFQTFLDKIEFKPAQVPVYANSSAAPYPASPKEMRALLSGQLERPVRFTQLVTAMHDAGIRTFIEVGPGATLTELTGRILGDKPHTAIAMDAKGAKGKDAVTGLWLAMARLAAGGVALDLAFAWHGYDGAAAAPVKMSAAAVPITGANYGKPYPPPGGAPALPRPNPNTVPKPVSFVESSKPVESGSDPMSASEHDAALAALREMQEQISKAHSDVQRAMAETHTAYLRASEAAFAQVNALLGGAGVAAPYVPAPVVQAVPVAVAGPTMAAPAVQASPVIVAPPPPGPVRAPLVESQKPVDLTGIMLDVVAEKTGYPRDIIALDMDLEADLGIDSIKRVEILSAISAQRLDLPQIDTKKLGAMRTLGAILEYLGAAAPVVVSTNAPVAAQGKMPADLSGLMLDVVAEKTGYPRDIIALDMDLEADLGIDSIKRVEILSAISAQRPDLPQIDTKKLGAMRTLGAILEYLGGAPAAAAHQGAVPTLEKKVSKTVTSMSNGARLDRRGLREVVAPIAAQPIPGLTHAKSIVVLDDGSDLGGALVKRLRERGLSVDLTDSVQPGADGVVVLGPREVSGADHVLDSARRLFGAAKDFAPRAASEGGAFITVQDSGGDFGLSGSSNGNAWFAGLPGLIKTIGQEWPQAAVKAIDLERGDHTADLLADRLIGELISGGAEHEIGLRADGRRTTLQEVDLPLNGARDSDLLKNKPVLVVTGGARGVTAACLLGLAKVAPIRVALLGRTPLEADPAGLEGAVTEADLRGALLTDARKRGEQVAPRELASRSQRILANREVRASLAALEAAGSEAIYIAGDVRDAAFAQKAVGEARKRWGRIDGIVHGAGTLADKRIEEKSLQQFDQVFATKVLGLRALLDATAGDDLQLICLFSSVAGRYGNAGQADYALANDILNKVARAEAVRRGGRCLVRSLNWGPWDGGMVTPELRDRFAGRGVPLISLDDGVAAFVNELTHADPQQSHVDVVLSGRAV